jgi:hypothetical protein
MDKKHRSPLTWSLNSQPVRQSSAALQLVSVTQRKIWPPHLVTMHCAVGKKENEAINHRLPSRLLLRLRCIQKAPAAHVRRSRAA